VPFHNVGHKKEDEEADRAFGLRKFLKKYIFFNWTKKYKYNVPTFLVPSMNCAILLGREGT
jgi:hypothetical protein